MVNKVLILDDLTSLPRFIEMELSAEGYQVSVVCDAVAEEAIAQKQPDLILLNWDLRWASGLDLCRQLQSAHNQHHPPAVITMVNDEVNYYLSQEVGAQSCLVKPFSMSDLLSAIEWHLADQPKKSEIPCAAKTSATV